MSDFYEIEFRPVHTEKSGDAICIRYQVDGFWYVHLVDGGFSTTAPDVTRVIRESFGTNRINHLVVTHPDKDHAQGIAPLLEEFTIEALWMLRPWKYAGQLLKHFTRYQSADAVAEKLRDTYPYIAEIEVIANRLGIPIFDPFQGAQIGHFKVLAPSINRYLQLVIQSDKTPQAPGGGILNGLMKAAKPLVRKVKAGWGSEQFSREPTSVENEMSVIQYASLCGDTILLTGDAGRDGLMEAAQYAVKNALVRPIKRFQVPHHGGRHNVSSELLDFWIGSRLQHPVPFGSERFQAIVSAAKEDEIHPRNAVVRAILHRGGFYMDTKDGAKIFARNSSRTFGVAPVVVYPDEEEVDD